MSSRKDTGKMMDMLEKMGMVKKTEDEQQQEVPAVEARDFAAPETVPRAPSAYAHAQTAYGITEETSTGSFWDEEPPPASEPDTDQFLDIDSLYRLFGLKTGGVDTVYLVEAYMKTLPDTLPAELRRSIILKIVAASGFDFDRLLNDGIDRVSRLNEYSSTFAARTEELVERHNVDIDALERQIQQIRELINERKNLHKRQFLAIESEAQRLKDVLDFITK